MKDKDNYLATGFRDVSPRCSSKAKNFASLVFSPDSLSRNAFDMSSRTCNAFFNRLEE